MSNEARNSWRSFTALLTVVVISIATIAIAPKLHQSELQKALYVGAVTLLFGGVLGGLIKIFLDDLVAGRARRADAATFVGNVLADLKAVYDRVARARILIPAHKSIKTYGDQMRDLIEARVQLKNVIRALDGRTEGVSHVSRTATIQEVEALKAYLDELTSEFRSNYKSLSDLQRMYEARATSLTEEYGKRRDNAAPPAFNTLPWEQLVRLPIIADFTGQGDHYHAAFEAHLDRASEILRAEAAAILGHTSAVSEAKSRTNEA